MFDTGASAIIFP
jgi:hypothetical protein